MIQFYAPEIRQTLTLPESDSAHAVRVLRLRTGDTISVVDGHGHRYVCRLSDAHPKRATVEILESHDIPPVWDYRIEVAVAPTKHNDRMEWLVEKLVEIGVNRITPIRCRFSERKEINTDRLVKIAVSAMKQSLKAQLPVIDPMTPIDEFIGSVTTAQRFMGYCSDDFERKLLAREICPGQDVTVMIGPEGDFSSAEVERAVAADFVPVTMGDNRLRTETAALVACDTCHVVNQLMR